MRNISYGIFLIALTLSSCGDTAFKKGKKGLEYKIISSGSGEKIKIGEFMQLHVGQYYATGKKDSLLSDSRTDRGPVIEKMDSASIPPAYFDIVSQLKVKDSLIIRITTDSAFGNSPQGMPPAFKKGHYMITTVKVLNIFKTQQAADSARTAEMKLAQGRDSIKNIQTLAKDEKELQAYFAKNNIKVIKAPRGTYVEIIQPGTGNNIDTSVVVSTNYTGRTMAGNMFDSNTDTSKHHVEPFNVNMTSDRTLGGNVIAGWKDGLTLLNKGTKAKFYIPSSLAYGPMERPEIPANSILIFDIEVVDVLNRVEAKLMAKAKMDQQQAKQKAVMDSLHKAAAMHDSNGKK